MRELINTEIEKQLRRSAPAIAEHLIKLLDQQNSGVTRDSCEALLDLTHRPGSSTEDNNELLAIALFTLIDFDQSGDVTKSEASNFITSALLCGVEVIRILVSVFRNAFVTPLLDKAVKAGVKK